MVDVLVSVVWGNIVKKLFKDISVKNDWLKVSILLLGFFMI